MYTDARLFNYAHIHTYMCMRAGECKDFAEKSLPEASAIAEGILTCKELVSAPANKLTPATLAAQAKAIAESSDAMSVKVGLAVPVALLYIFCFGRVGQLFRHRHFWSSAAQHPV